MRMLLPKIEHLSLETEAGRETAVATDGKIPTDNAVADDLEEDPIVSHADAVIEEYLMENVPTYQKLQQLRAKGWENPRGDHYFERQRRQADENSEETVQRLNHLMIVIAKEMQCFTRAFTIKSREEPQRVLDLCMAPGTYLAKALEQNPAAHAVAFTLPEEQGGLVPVISESETVKIHFLDITMLAADMGVSPDKIDPSHPDAASFLHSRYLDDGRTFDLAICDGAARRTQERAAYRSHNREVRRLLLTQLALGLEHLRPGGTMIVLLHKVEKIHTIRLLRDFKSFANVVLFKPRSGHTQRSSFYMIASEIRSADEKALQAVQEWKREWKVSTLGTDEEWRDDNARLADFEGLGIEGVLEEFGPTLVKLGKKVWQTQAEALSRASFVKK